MQEQARKDRKILASYATGPDQLQIAIAGLSEEQLDLALSAETWTIRQIIHHLTDGDDIWKIFVKRAIGNPKGCFELVWYWEIPQNDWVRHWAYAQREIEPSLALFRANHAHVIQLLETIPGVWEKSLLLNLPNGKEQPASIEEIIAMQSHHVEGHVNDIRKIREKYGV